MSLIEILLGVALPVLIGIGLTLATMGSGGAVEFWVARIAFIVTTLVIAHGGGKPGGPPYKILLGWSARNPTSRAPTRPSANPVSNCPR
jgi:hypothetical protein